MSLAGFACAIIGSFISFLPLLQILLPLKASAIMPGAPATLLGTITATGAAVAGITNFAIGWASDRTRSRWGRRRPWIACGLFGILLSYALLWRASSGPALVIAFASYQLAFNMMFSPLLALIADRVPPARRGRASALIALGSPFGTMIGAIVIGSLFLRDADRFIALAAIVIVSILPFTILMGADPPRPRKDIRPALRPPQRFTRNFALGCLGRVCVLCAFTIGQFYVLLYVRAVQPRGGPHAVEHGVTLLCTVFGIVSALMAIMIGQFSDRIGRRRPVVIAAALVVATGMAGLAFAPSWPTAIAAYALFAAGAGAHTAVEFALMVDILPSPERTARDLGILNLSNIVPQITAPLGIAWIMALPDATIHWGFAAGAAAAVLGAGLVALMRSVP